MAINVDKLVLQIAEKTREIATREGNIPFWSGDLRKSTQTESLGGGKAAVGSNLIYARPVHDGRPAITIRPKKKKALKFNIGGKTVFSRFVKQKARKGKPFLVNALKQVQQEGYDFLYPELKKQVGGLLANAVLRDIKINMGGR